MTRNLESENAVSDIFDTLVPLSEPTLEYARDKYGIRLKMKDLVPDLKNGPRFRALCEEYLLLRAASQPQTALFPDAVEGIKQAANEGLQIHLVTSGSTAFKEVTLYLLKDLERFVANIYFQDSPPISDEAYDIQAEGRRIAVDRGEYAKKIGAKIGIDDSTTNVLIMSALYDMRMALRTQPWNEHLAVAGDIMRCKTIPEALALLTAGRVQTESPVKDPFPHMRVIARPIEVGQTS